MRFVADESVDHSIVVRLREDGHDVIAVAELTPSIADDDVFAQANQYGGLLLTSDKDFGEIVFRQKRVTTGVALIRLPGLSPDTKAGIVSQAISEHQAEIPFSFTVISPGMVRIRPTR